MRVLKFVAGGLALFIGVMWAWDALFGGKARAEIEFLERMRSPEASDWIREMAREGNDERDNLLELGYKGCDTMSQKSFDEWEFHADAVMPPDFDVMGAAWILYSAEATLCPEHQGWFGR